MPQSGLWLGWPGDTAVHAAAQLDAPFENLSTCMIYYFPSLSCLFVYTPLKTPQSCY